MVYTSRKQVVSDEYRQPVKFALAIQLPICLMSMLALDFGLLSKICGCAMLGYWLAVSWIWIRRPFAPQRSDLVFIRYGFLAIFITAIAVGELKLALFLP